MFRLMIPVAFAVIIGCQPNDGSHAASLTDQGNFLDKKPIELIDVTYDGFDKEIAKLKGKVVAVDVWATFCAPCVKKFPLLVKLHEDHAAKGLVCVSVSTDDLESKPKALEFLKDKKAEFPNYRLSESNEKISKELNEKYPTDAQPVMFIFNRKGEKVKQFESKDKHEEVEAFIVKLLAEK